jgi:hypothetical protein
LDKLDLNFKEFPFDIFHICTHGGELTGWTFEQYFIDRLGTKYTMTYDEVASFSKGKKPDGIEVQRKWYPTSLNGFAWNSQELRNKNYPSSVFHDMFKAVHAANAIDKKQLAKKKIPNSCYIETVDGHYQGMLRFLASHNSPIMFNNFCWS